MMGYLTRDQILGVPDIMREDVDVPEWGGTVCVKGLSGTERDAFEASMVGRNGAMKLDNIRAKLVSLAVVDPDTGESLFSVGDVAILGGKSAAALNRVFGVAQRLAGLTESDIEELEKN